jgi:hypothetical protein
MAVNISLKNIKLKDFSLHTITFKNVEEKELVTLYEMISDQLYEIQASLITAILIGDRSAARAVKKASKKVFDETNWPLLWIGDQENKKFSGSFIAVSGVNMKTFCGKGFTTKYFETPKLKFGYVGDVVAEDLLAGDEVINMIYDALRLVGVGAEHIVHCWNFMESEILNSTKGEALLTLSSEGNAVNTIIGSNNSYKKAGMISVLALQPKDASFKVTKYGVNENNSLLMEGENTKALFISGITENNNGDEVSNDEAVKCEIEHCIAKVEEILRTTQLSWNDLFRGVAYFKNLNDAGIFKRICQEKKVPLAPIISVQVNYIQSKANFSLEADFVHYHEG